MMKSARLRILSATAIAMAALSTSAAAQRPANADQRMLVLEQQVAASQATAIRLEQRLDAIERQLQQLINQGEVSGHTAQQAQADMAKLRSDMDARMTALENGARAAPRETAAIADPEPESPKSEPKVASVEPSKPAPADTDPDQAVSDPGEDAYSEGFRLWRDGQYDQSITALRAFVSGFPKHRRVSYARNLVGRALLDKGQARPAAEALLANYRADPKGERAADSLYYLGQALMKLNQPNQACKAYSELEDVYGASIRGELKSLVNQGKADANCS
ncbi:tetratricopeptide repeat protein [Sphingomonas sabuli]|uniref:Tetratricopeptide repeat protein n=1 Tax=Sphingomonas sabuli TaxID=2764186 RepID=A0A7G9L1F0_9SPHN|nr:tetratricopeptide repeat protein [Sphingomonas sabuli]QNM82449.1 tetratricopeptide repeat protein [Sphingomonas sabuli]